MLGWLAFERAVVVKNARRRMEKYIAKGLRGMEFSSQSRFLLSC